MTLLTEKIIDQLLRDMRDLHNKELCNDCNGWGIKSYANTATYHHCQVAGQAITDDVCNKCWGSGDQNNHWPSHLELNR